LKVSENLEEESYVCGSIGEFFRFIRWVTARQKYAISNIETCQGICFPWSLTFVTYPRPPFPVFHLFDSAYQRFVFAQWHNRFMK